MSGHVYGVHLAGGQYVDFVSPLPPGVDDGQVARWIAAAHADAVEFRTGPVWLPV
ncbi:hypothetical protein [Mycobacterium sp. 94-17]|uniref:hypothetical protein n=1 Tax=Mycobacterium sp. 94-17 TaxID=2986147 RepID=UPI002D1EF742|nr:hypothetical protein [Mycobacterium sp. 94-17]MEB4210962.1 hypothetical protein [Mycobacterium sp. 94-17]